MDRRRFIATVGSALAAPLVRAQAPAEVRTMGYLVLEETPKFLAAEGPAAKLLAKYGWTYGKNLLIERRYAELRTERLAEMADDMVRRRVDVLFTTGSEATLAAARATSTIPIVFFGVQWPVEQGLIDSFARPGRNLTGTSWYTGVEVSNKRMQFLRELAPNAKRVAWFWPPAYAEKLSGGQADMISPMRAAAKDMGFETRFFDIRKLEDIDSAFKSALSWKAQAVSASGPHVSAARDRFAELALRHRLPTAFPSFSNVEAGGLVAYGLGDTEGWRMFARSVEYIDRILRGAKPADLPVERPDRYELVINRKTATALGLKIPQSLLLRADRVIE